MKISYKLISVIILLVLLPSVIIGAIAYSEAKKNIELQSQSQIDLMRQEVSTQSKVYVDVADAMHSYAAKNIGTNINVAREKFRTYCGDYAEKEGDTLVCQKGPRLNDKENSDVLVQEIKSIVKGQCSIFVKVDAKTGKKISTTEKQGMYAYGYMMEPEMYEMTIKQGKFFNMYTKIEGEFETKNCDPIKSKAGEVIGTLCVGIPEGDVAQNAVEKIEKVRFGDSGFVYVISTLKKNYGEFAAHPQMKSQSALNIPYAKEMIERKNGEIEYDVNGQRKVAAYTFYEPYDWIIVAEENKAESGATIASVRNNILVSSVVSLLIALAVGIFASQRITRPIKELTKAANKISDGDFSAKMPEVRTKDEVAELASSMEMMFAALKAKSAKKK